LLWSKSALSHVVKTFATNVATGAFFVATFVIKTFRWKYDLYMYNKYLIKIGLQLQFSFKSVLKCRETFRKYETTTWNQNSRNWACRHCDWRLSISSTFYVRIFCTKVFSLLRVWLWMNFSMKNAHVKYWWNWHLRFDNADLKWRNPPLWNFRQV